MMGTLRFAHPTFLTMKLPDRLTEKQKARRVNNLLQELRKAGKITNEGSRIRPKWKIVAEDDGGNSP